MTKTLGLYLHVPFCASKCRYCDFYSFAAGDEQMEAYTETLCRSIRDWGQTCTDYTVDTVYFGGGTPSLLGGARLVRVLDAARAAFQITPDAEITVECNPDSMDESLLDALHRAGVNRLSVGVQSADEGELQRLGRRHSFQQAVDAVQQAQAAGFSNLSLDLMYGLPGQTEQQLLQSAWALLELDPTHLSVYALKLEEGTPLFLEHPVLPDEDAQADMYIALCRLLERAGFEHYEISNWAKPGFRARHNARYWDLSEYLGLGPSAHSLLRGRRFAYGRSVEDFVRGVPPAAEEDVEGFSPALEYLMLALRTSDGVSPEEFEARFGRPFAPFARVLARYEKPGLAKRQAGRWRLTEPGFLVSNPILTDVLSAEE